MSESFITLQNISKLYPKSDGHRRVEVLKDINLTIHKGEFLILLGPSGCGKSTLLRIIAELDTKTSGTVTYSQSYDKNKVSFVFQNFGILPWLTVAQNVELNLIASNMASHEREKEVKAILEPFGLLSFKDHFPHELSGGMRQRVGIARAFVSKPDIIFLDEPFSELDFFTATALRQILLDLWQQQGTTVVMVSHYIDEALTLADRVAVFSDRPSSIKTIVTNSLPRPRNARSKEFFELEDQVLNHFSSK